MIPKHGERGFYLIGLLLALAIMFILNGGYFAPGPSGLSTYQKSMGDTKSMDCSVTRSSIKTNMMSWQITNAADNPTIEQLKNSGIQVPPCREGGEYSVGKDGNIYCSKHTPDPAAVQDAPRKAARNTQPGTAPNAPRRRTKRPAQNAAPPY